MIFWSEHVLSTKHKILLATGYKDKASTIPTKSTPGISAEDEKSMENYGIIRVPVDYFWLGEYRYSSLKDAIVQAKRQEKLD